jgi:tetratricopeptide (TPR) repeat protein
VYVSAVSNGFVWDDNTIIERQLGALRDLRSLFLPPRHLEFAGSYYRPLIFATYRLDEWLGSGAAWAYHLTPLVAHMVVSSLVYALGTAIGLRRGEALGGAVLFAVHPVHAESVAWMAGRSDIFASLFLVAAALVVWRSGGPIGTGIGALLLLCGFLSKESALAGVILLPLGAGVLRRGSARRACVSVAVALLPYVALRLLAGASRPTPSSQPPQAEHLGAFLGFYAAKLAVPLHLNAVILDLPLVGLYASLSAITAACTWIYIRRLSRDRPAAFLLMWVGLNLLPALIPVLWRAASAPFAERYLYTPSIGFCLLGAHLFGGWTLRHPRLSKPAVAAFLLVVAVAGAVATRRTAVWRDSYTFWSHVAADHPDRWMPRFQLAKALADSGDLARAEEAYATALPLASGRQAAMVLTNLGSLYNQTSRPDLAEAAWRRAAAQDAGYVDPVYNLGSLLWVRGKALLERGESAGAAVAFAEARAYLDAALRLDPSLARAHYALGSLGFLTGDFDLARRHLGETIRLAPRSSEAEYARLVSHQVRQAMALRGLSAEESDPSGGITTQGASSARP